VSAEQQTISVVIVKSGAFKGREATILDDYNGRWKHLRFKDGKKPREAYVPPEAVN